MKTYFWLILFIGYGFVSHADLPAVSFLGRYQGVQKVGRCTLEVRLRSEGEISGDLLITDGHGRELYSPLVFQGQNTPNSVFSLELGRRYLHYEYDDWLKDSFDGQRLSIRLELITESRSSALKRVEFGFYSTSGPRRIYQWIICGG